MLKAQSHPDVTKHRICVASFSMDPDSLSQWRAYGPVAVGFDLAGVGFGYSNTVRRGPVVYDPAHQSAMLRLLAHLNATAWERERPSEKRRLRSLYFDNVDRLLDVVAFFKNAGFVDERELRMVHTENSDVLEKFGKVPFPERFRVSGGLIVPYVTTKDLAKNSPDVLPITEVVIGPSANAERLLHGVQRALLAHGYKVPVRISGITYRRWDTFGALRQHIHPGPMDAHLYISVGCPNSRAIICPFHGKERMSALGRKADRSGFLKLQRQGSRFSHQLGEALIRKCSKLA